MTNPNRRYPDYETLIDVPAANDRLPPGPDDFDNALAMVRQIAAGLVARLPRHVEFDELVALGNLGLCDALQRYDPARAVSFCAFAARRVRGAMLDWLRQGDPVSRDERSRLRQNLDESASVVVTNLDEASGCAVDEPRCDERMEHTELLAAMRAAMGELSERDRYVVERHFFDEQPLKTIGVELSVTESRVCQLVAGAVERLREAMGVEPADFQSLRRRTKAPTQVKVNRRPNPLLNPLKEAA